MKRLLCIISSLDTGGAETFLMKIFRKLPKDFKFDFIVSSEDGYYEHEVMELGGEIYRVPLRTQHPFRTFKRIKEIVKEKNYQYILKLCDTPKGLFDLMAARFGGAKVICVRSCNASSSENIIVHTLYSALRTAFNGFADIKIAPSELAASYTFGKKQVEKNKVVFLHNGLDLSNYKYIQSGRISIRKEFNIKEDFLVGHVGRFNIQKNHGFLLKVFVEIKKRIPKAKLILIGTGELEAQIRKQIEELDIIQDVIITGVRSDIPNLLSAMDVFLFPSLYEGMPNTVIEAQATGLPCVISDSITREVSITDLVKYKSLQQSIEEWAEQCCKYTGVKIQRENYNSIVASAGYDINDVVAEFVKAVFK